MAQAAERSDLRPPEASLTAARAAAEKKKRGSSAENVKADDYRRPDAELGMQAAKSLDLPDVSPTAAKTRADVSLKVEPTEKLELPPLEPKEMSRPWYQVINDALFVGPTSVFGMLGMSCMTRKSDRSRASSATYT